MHTCMCSPSGLFTIVYITTENKGHEHLCMCIAAHFPHNYFHKHQHIFFEYVYFCIHIPSMPVACIHICINRRMCSSWGSLHRNSTACVIGLLQQMCTCWHALINGRTWREACTSMHLHRCAEYMHTFILSYYIILILYAQLMLLQWYMQTYIAASQVKP